VASTSTWLTRLRVERLARVIKMAASVVFHDKRSEQVSYKQYLHYVQKCFSCVDLESQLKEVHLEISSSQFIIKLLYKELNGVIAKRTCV
jgi:hypothetical protein